MALQNPYIKDDTGLTAPSAYWKVIPAMAVQFSVYLDQNTRKGGKKPLESAEIIHLDPKDPVDAALIDARAKAEYQWAKSKTQFQGATDV